MVAHEIKTLAVRTASATEEISRKINAIHTASGVTDQNVSSISRAFVEMREISTEIATGLEVQLDATKSIDCLLNEAQSSVDNVARSDC